MTNSSSMIYKIGDRIECAGYYGTVKYIGEVEGKAATWLGIDWDNPDRGKHNGNVNGRQYFTTRHEKSGSFVRPEKVVCGRSAVTSIKTRYGQDDDEYTSKINQQNQLLIQQSINAPFLEMVGFDKVFNKQSDLNSLKIINLREQCVNSAGVELGQTCPIAEELDISKNLLSSWSEIFDICQQLSQLQWLNVSENFMTIPDNYASYHYPQIKTLICGSMELDWDDVLKITTVFPNVEELRAPFNKIQNLKPLIDNFNQLKLLDLEGNRIEKWSEICKLGNVPQLEYLIIENIGLRYIEFNEDAREVSIFSALKKLCIVNNLIEDWKSVSELNRLRSLESLRISKNPVLETEDINTVHQLIIAKIGNLKILNGAEVEEAERRGAEYDYIKKYGLEWLKVRGTEAEAEFHKSHNRYLELIQRHGEPEESELIDKPKMIQSSLINLKLTFQDRTVEKKLPPTITVQKLIVLIQKLFRLNERPKLLYTCTNDREIEFELDEELKEIGLYSMKDGDQITALL